ncbi:glycosyltransferase 87 family protein [Corynebacterium pacaense]|uniref:glycosyltransferase 87 family protein n=1 Tax=Corynebacterium pacaense TaxID=1816684 RepID=UPI0009B9EFD0|nr:glycosyltransferase 87 family protein [Corynebacterium pacaense]
MRAKVHPWIALSWIAILVLGTAVNFEVDGRLRYLLDLDVYIQGAERFWSDQPLYDVYFPTRHENLPFTYPPFAAILFTPVWWLSGAIGQTATERVVTLLSLIALWLASRAVAAATGSRIPVVVVMAICLCSWPVLDTLYLGQVNIVLMAMVILDATRAHPRLPIGVLTGIAAAIKLTPAVFGLYFLFLLILRRDPRGLYGMAAGFGLAGGFAWLANPSAFFTFWTQTLTSTGRIGDPAYAKNVSIHGLLSRFPQLGAETTIWLAAVCAVITLACLCLWRILRTDTSPAAQLLAITVVALVSLLCSPVSWNHHWVWLGPLAIALWSTGHRFLACWAVFAQSLGPFQLFIDGGGGDGREFQWSPLQHLLVAHYLWFALSVLITVALRPRVGPEVGARPDTT